MDYRWKGNDLLGDIEVLTTASGNILREILLAGYVPGISSRGLGSVENSEFEGEDDIVEVQDDFSLLCWDAVSDPSTHKAYFKTVSGMKPVHENYTREEKQHSKLDELLRDIRCDLSGICSLC